MTYTPLAQHPPSSQNRSAALQALVYCLASLYSGSNAPLISLYSGCSPQYGIITTPQACTTARPFLCVGPDPDVHMLPCPWLTLRTHSAQCTWIGSLSVNLVDVAVSIFVLSSVQRFQNSIKGPYNFRRRACRNLAEIEI
jgi:hypothetical protein